MLERLDNILRRRDVIREQQQGALDAANRTKDFRMKDALTEEAKIREEQLNVPLEEELAKEEAIGTGLARRIIKKAIKAGGDIVRGRSRKTT
jgi:hypothetical protein